MKETEGRKYLFSLIPSDITVRTGLLTVVNLGLALFGMFPVSTNGTDLML